MTQPVQESLDRVAADAQASGSRKLRKVLLATGIGHFVEWFDFGLYGTLAAIIGLQFFQSSSPSVALLSSFAVFGAGFIMRPLGGLFFGSLGDRKGRQKVLATVILLTSGATFVMGLLPTYHQIGITATVLLVITRLVQGFAAGGESSGATTYLAEYAPTARRGYFTCWIDNFGFMAFVVGSGLVFLLTAALGESTMNDWGWRIPFFIAIPLGGVALWLRVNMEETPSFVRQQTQSTPPQAAGFASTLKAIITGIGRLMVWSAAGYTYLVIMPTYLQSALHTGFNQALLIAVISNAGFALTIIPSGMLSDRIGRRAVMVTAAVMLLILALPLLKILQTESSTLLVKACVVFIAGGLVGMLAGPGPAMLAEMFPTRVRYTGLGLAYSLSNAIFSGCAGLIITGLIKQTGNLDIPAYYVMATAVVSVIALMTLRKDDHQRTLDDQTTPESR